MLQAPPIGNQKPGIVALALPLAGPTMGGKLFNLSPSEAKEAYSSYCTVNVHVLGNVSSFIEM